MDRNRIKKLVLIVSIFVLVISVSYAFFAPLIGEGISNNANVISGTTDDLYFTEGEPLSITATQFNFTEGGENLSSETTTTANLRANTGDNYAKTKYQIYLDIVYNKYQYTTLEETPEVLLTITDPNGNELTTVDDLTYVTGDGVSGFDITEKQGRINLVYDYEIVSNSSSYYTVQEWGFKITYINLESDQGINENQNLQAEIVMTKGEYNQFVSYAVYSETDNSLRFYNNKDVVNVGDTYNDLIVTNLYMNIENVTGDAWSGIRSNVLEVVVEDTIQPLTMLYWFQDFVNTSKIDVSKVDTSKTTNMQSLFKNAGYNVTEKFEIMGLSGWNTSNVSDMAGIFFGSGYNASEWIVGTLNDWDVSNVINMGSMFCEAGIISSTWNIGDLSSWDTSKATNMSYMFYMAGHNDVNWSIGNLSNWNVSKVTNMSGMFYSAGKNADAFSLGDLSSWNVSNVQTFKLMFRASGYNSSSWSIGSISSWEPLSATDMSEMFQEAGYNASYSLNLSSWQVPLVTSYSNFNSDVTSKITSPVWVN